MTHIQLPHLIREKMKDYLFFTEWRDKMSQVCIEYNKRTRYFDYINDSYPQFLSYKSKNNKIMYNYRFQQGLLFNVSSGNVYCNYKRVCKLSPNY